MDWEKYNQIPNYFATAREIGIAAATLGAMARRGFVEVLNTTPKKYKKANNSIAQILQIYEEHKADYFILRKKNEKIGMLCSFSNNSILDCWGKVYDITNVDYIKINGIEYSIQGGGI